jgi:hypothetical protein
MNRAGGTVAIVRTRAARSGALLAGLAFAAFGAVGCRNTVATFALLSTERVPVIDAMPSARPVHGEDCLTAGTLRPREIKMTAAVDDAVRTAPPNTVLLTDVSIRTVSYVGQVCFVAEGTPRLAPNEAQGGSPGRSTR